MWWVLKEWAALTTVSQEARFDADCLTRLLRGQKQPQDMVLGVSEMLSFRAYMADRGTGRGMLSEARRRGQRKKMRF